jgi:hypothetical protein
LNVNAPISRSRGPRPRSRARVYALASLLGAFAATEARADDATPTRCAPEDEACLCERDGLCWDFQFLSTGPGSMLALSASFTSASSSDAPSQDGASLLVRYRGEVHRARGLFNQHVLAFGAIGAGSFGNEGEIGGAFDVGVRAPFSRVSGPLVRIGPSGSLFGNDALQLAMIEPLRLTAAYQLLLHDLLFETGLTLGMLGGGRFAAARTAASLTGSIAIGQYLTLHASAFRFDGRATYVQRGASGNAELGTLQVEACTLPRPIAVCVDARYIRGRRELRPEQEPRAANVSASGTYAGLTVGLIP